MGRHVGFIKLPRDVLRMPIIKDARDFTLWIYCSLRAGHQKYRDCEPGQFISSRQKMAVQLGWSRNTLKVHLDHLMEHGYLDVEDTGCGAKITVRNWLESEGEMDKNPVLTLTPNAPKLTTQVVRNRQEAALKLTPIAPKLTETCTEIDHVQEYIQEGEPFVQGNPRREFEIFWRAYPRKDWKLRAEQAFDALPDVSLSTLMDCLARAKWTKQWIDEGGRYIPAADKWLNELWRNYLPAAQDDDNGEELWKTY